MISDLTEIYSIDPSERTPTRLGIQNWSNHHDTKWLLYGGNIVPICGVRGEG